jgi:hypothetical protein
MLKMPFFHPTISGAVKWVAINTLAQPVLASTTVGNTDSFQANYAYATPYNNSELSYIGSGQKISVGTSPYIVQVESTLLFMLLKFN